jgi:pyruvate/2-oxoglutarate dehydrogenase complex dihydrolipoamide acyltransferase (E2) component
MKTLSLLLCVIWLCPLCHASPLDQDSVFDKLHADRIVMKQDFEENSKLMKAFKKKELISATDLMNAIDNVLERTASEGVLLNVFDRVTSSAAKADAETLIREHYANLAELTETDVEAVHFVVRDHRTKELTALALKVEEDIQRIARRYRALSKE